MELQRCLYYQPDSVAFLNRINSLITYWLVLFFNTRTYCNPLRYRVKCEWLMYWSTKLKCSFLVLDLLSTSIQYSKTCRTNSILLSRRIVKNISKCVLLITFCLFYSCSNITNQISQNESHWSISRKQIPFMIWWCYSIVYKGHCYYNINNQM